MQIFVRPPKPDTFDDHVKDTRKVLDEFFRTRAAAVSTPAALPAGTSPPSPTKPDFPDKWGKFKAAFSKAQNGKCGYCEMAVIGGQPGDVEHFFPKGEVWELGEDAETLGSERLALSTVEGRKRKVISEQGYWWLAYDWNNYLLSCQVCNQYWKLSFFPVRNVPRNLPPAKDYKEDALLLNPFNKKYDPCEHLYFDDLGQIGSRNKSPRGLATIRTCGLDRESLRFWRMQNASRAHFLVKDLNVAVENGEQKKIVDVLRDFWRLGDERFPHSGMVRAIFYQGTGMKWSALEQILASQNRA